MKIISFSVQNYRSIEKAHKIKLKDYNVLIGKNNEGKSNILRALYVCLFCINDFSRFRFSLKHDIIREEPSYNWERDFPVQLQKKNNWKRNNF